MYAVKHADSGLTQYAAPAPSREFIKRSEFPPGR